jgi:hypothetical protein
MARRAAADRAAAYRETLRGTNVMFRKPLEP